MEACRFGSRPGREPRFEDMLLAGLVEIDQFRAGRLLQGKLVVVQRFVDHQLHHGQPDRVFLLRTVDLDNVGKADAVVVLIDLVGRLGGNVSVLVVDNLMMRHQVGAVEDDLA